MIEATPELIPQERQDKIKAWLVSTESQWIEEIVKGQIGQLISEGGNAAANMAVGVLSARDVPPETKDKMAAAAVLQIFLVTLNELRKQDTFSNVTLKIK